MYNRCILLKLVQQTTESNKLCFAAFLHSDRIIYGKNRFGPPQFHTAGIYSVTKPFNRTLSDAN